MEQRNYQFLRDSLALLGFSDVFDKQLKTKMELGFTEFELKAQNTIGTDVNQYAVQFKKGENSDYYFLNSVKATMLKENQEAVVQTFNIYRNKGFNIREMNNLMNGRPVYKTYKENGMEVGRWTKLDPVDKKEDGTAVLRSYYDNVTKFNLEKEVAKLNLVYGRNEKEELMNDLRAGDRISVTLRQNGKIETAFIEVAPQMAGLILYNKDMEKIRNTNTNSMQVISDEATSNKTVNGQKQAAGEKLPETTKNLMNKIENGQTKNTGQNKKVG